MENLNDIYISGRSNFSAYIPFRRSLGPYGYCDLPCESTGTR